MSNKRKASFTEQLRRAGQDQDGPYFERHPTATSYTRPATPHELRATGFPPGTMVHVQRVGIQRIRGFVPPNVEGN